MPQKHVDEECVEEYDDVLRVALYASRDVLHTRHERKIFIALFVFLSCTNKWTNTYAHVGFERLSSPETKNLKETHRASS